MKHSIPHARLLLAAGCLLALSAVALFDPALRAQAGGSRAEQFRQMSTQAETTGLAQPFVGITAKGQVEPGLFALKSTGVSTERRPHRRGRVSQCPGRAAALEDGVSHQ